MRALRFHCTLIVLALASASFADTPAEDVQRDITRVQNATRSFASLDKAVAAGYARDGGGCVQNQPHGAMGFHHYNNAWLDAKLEVERPEILVYERLANGEYRLNGVEYIVPVLGVARDQ